eukprot:sb/3477688/
MTISTKRELTPFLPLQVLKMMVGTNLKDVQLQQIVDKTILIADRDGDGKISFEEFAAYLFKNKTAIYTLRRTIKPLCTALYPYVMLAPMNQEPTESGNTGPWLANN